MSERATSIPLIAGTLALCLPACGQEQKPGQPAPPPERKAASAKPDMIIRPDHRVRWSKVCDQKTLDALKAGRLRLGITVKAFKPPALGPVAFVVHLIPSKNAKRQEIDRFEITPNTPFRVSDGAAPQRFLIDMKDHITSLKESKLRIEVGFDDSSGKLKGGMAEVTFELVKLE
jgi:hypothetical protein